MKIKTTMKIGDHTEVINEEASKMLQGSKEMENIFTAKGMIKSLMTMIDVNPENQGKRIEIILEFDDDTYIVVGRKPNEDPNYGT